MIAKLTEIIVEMLGMDDEEISLEANIREDFDADSLDMVDIIMSCEDEFHVEIPDEVLDSLVLVKDVVDYIEKNM
ncbi:MAG: acyl carrier protein [Oscillospiraceae bacterium]|nr:acyl carrier protein [Oscillospiraceae bacterium]